MRDAFAVLFFVSVGMLFNPSIVVEAPLALLATVLIILIAKSVAAYLVVRLYDHSSATALIIAASLAQIGEFSFILAGLGLSLKLLPEEGRDLILAGAIITILINPLLFAALDVMLARRERPEAAEKAEAESRSGPRADQTHDPQGPCGADRPWQGGQLHQRRFARALDPALRHRGRRRHGGRSEG